MAWYTIYSEAYAINETIDTSLFGRRASSGADATIYLWFGAVVLVFIVIGVVYNWLNNKKLLNYQ